jgi:TonB family protein
MNETWRRWEGQIINGEFPLQSYLGGSNQSAVFLTQRAAGEPHKAAIKIIAADPLSSESQLIRWRQAAKLVHPNLIRIFEAGGCELEGTPLLYVVMEHAEEDLSQILPQRALAPAEVQEMLSPVLRALAYIHGNGLVHGHVKPSNIMATGDQVKVSSDTLAEPGEAGLRESATGAYDPPEAERGMLSAASDVWSLGMTLVEVLTQHLPVWDRAQQKPPALPAGIPEPFLEIAGHCLEVDPQQRCTVAEIAGRLEAVGRQPARPATGRPVVSGSTLFRAKKKPETWPYILALAAAAVIAVILLAGSKMCNPPSPAPAVQGQEAKPGGDVPKQSRLAQEPKASPLKPAKGSSPQRTSQSQGSSPTPASPAMESPVSASAPPKAAGAGPGTNENTPAGPVVKGAVVTQVVPQVSPRSRSTIQGTVRVRVKVKVDASGKVVAATLDSPGPSKYFARIALEAAQGWKFAPAQVRGQAVASEWILRFGFSRTDTEVVPMQTAP